MGNNELSLEEVTKKLDIIINLLLEKSEKMSPTKKIEYLDSIGIGLTQAEIAKVVGKGSNYVGSVLSQAKKKGKGRKRG